MPSRSPTRFLAPLALALAFFAVFVVLSSDSDSGDSGSTSTVRSTQASTTSTTRKAARKPTTPRRYTVKSGDVLSAIAERTGVPLQRILDLNPDLDPQALQAGQKLKLSR